MALDYPTYLELDKILDAQKVRSDPPEHDEMLFIVIHQAYELWFKLMLHEFEKVKRDLSAGDLYGAMATMKRVRTVMKTLVGQLDILETMTPMSFRSFRDRLETSSGFQSAQFRALEFLFGYKRPDLMKHLNPHTPEYKDLEARLKARTLVDHLYDFLATRGVAIPRAVKDRDLAAPVEPNEEVQKGILKLYREDPETTGLLELFVDFDEGMQEWRYRHVKLVERTIGNKQGTGGSLGVEFLKRSLFKPIFADLWAIRHEL